MPQRIRIVNPGGAGWQTKITDAETGDDLLNLSHVEIAIDMQGMPTATVYTFIAPEVDLTVFAQQKNVCPCCRQVVTIGNTTESNQQ